MNRIVTVLLAGLVLSCGSSGPKVEEIVTSGRLSITQNGQETSIPLQGMDIYLVDPDSGGDYPETFLVHGEGVKLAGAFPKDLKVGYEEELERLVGRTVKIEAKSSTGGETVKAHITLAGEKIPLKGGTLEFVRFLGNNPNGAGGAVEAKVHLDRAEGGSLDGTMLVLAKTWG